MITDHVAYLLVTIPVTLGVGHTLFSSGRLFLIDVFSGNERTADAVNRLLLTEVYLVNLAGVLLALRFGRAVAGIAET